MSHVALIINALDGSWTGYESLSQAIHGISEEEAHWQDPSYQSLPQKEGWPKEGTIFWQIAHIALCKRYYIDCLKNKSSKDIIWPIRIPDPKFSKEMDYLRVLQDEMRDLIKKLSDSDLNLMIDETTPLHQYLHEKIRHDVWHASQIAVLRRRLKASH